MVTCQAVSAMLPTVDKSFIFLAKSRLTLTTLSFMKFSPQVNKCTLKLEFILLYPIYKLKLKLNYEIHVQLSLIHHNLLNIFQPFYIFMVYLMILSICRAI
jgi:hypothetical protein